MKTPQPVERSHRFAAAVQVEGLGGKPDRIQECGEPGEPAKSGSNTHGGVFSGGETQNVDKSYLRTDHLRSEVCDYFRPRSGKKWSAEISAGMDGGRVGRLVLKAE
jgi:hypothetical protein